MLGVSSRVGLGDIPTATFYRQQASAVRESYLTSPLNRHEPAPSTAFARARPSPPCFGRSGVTPALSIPHKKLRISGRKPERPFMTDTTLAKIAARAAFSGREESDVTSEPLSEWKRRDGDRQGVACCKSNSQSWVFKRNDNN